MFWPGIHVYDTFYVFETFYLYDQFLYFCILICLLRVTAWPYHCNSFCHLVQKTQKAIGPQREADLDLPGLMSSVPYWQICKGRKQLPSVLQKPGFFETLGSYCFAWLSSIPVTIPRKLSYTLPPFICFGKAQSNLLIYNLEGLIVAPTEAMCPIVENQTPSYLLSLKYFPQARSKTISSYCTVLIHLYSQAYIICQLALTIELVPIWSRLKNSKETLCPSNEYSVSLIVQAIHLRLWGSHPGLEKRKAHIQPCHLSFGSIFVSAQWSENSRGWGGGSSSLQHGTKYRLF